jgi:hypothetical protein
MVAKKVGRRDAETAEKTAGKTDVLRAAMMVVVRVVPWAGRTAFESVGALAEQSADMWVERKAEEMAERSAGATAAPMAEQMVFVMVATMAELMGGR